MDHPNDCRATLRHKLRMPEPVDAVELDDEGNLLILTANRVRLVTAEELEQFMTDSHLINYPLSDVLPSLEEYLRLLNRMPSPLKDTQEISSQPGMAPQNPDQSSS